MRVSFEDVRDSIIQRINDLRNKSNSVLPEACLEHLSDFVSCYTEEMIKGRSLTPSEFDEIFKILPKALLDLRDYHFTPHHVAVTQPVDYYTWGNQLWQALIDFNNSRFEGMDKLMQIDKYLQQKHNVVLLSNHQIEPDAQILSITFERHGFPDLAKKVMLVAGNRVRDDPISVPFSIGRNLLCVHSKKYIDHPPKLKAQKLQDNLTAVQTLQALFKEGGQLIWVAPSGGRDRADENGILQMSPFDPKNIQMFSLMAKKSLTPTHFFPMALYSSSIAPPPQKLHTDELGERRSCKYSPIGVGVCDEIAYTDADSLCAAAEASVRDKYNIVRQT